jgi:hypothetical protein
MPSVMDAPELVEHVETHDLTIKMIEYSQPRRAPGFWRTLAHQLIRYLTPMSREGYTPSCSASRTFEAPMDRLARENPYLSVYALALI